MFDARNPTVQCRDQFVQLTFELNSLYRQGLPPKRGAWLRELFHTSPQLVQRQ